jgi:hypothetical protein
VYGAVEVVVLLVAGELLMWLEVLEVVGALELVIIFKPLVYPLKYR